MKFVLAGHGLYPQGVLETIELLIGRREDVYVVIEAVENDDYKSLVDDLIAAHEEEGLVVFTDILEGSVNQYFMRKLKDHRFYLITGFNIALLLELLLKNDLNAQEIAATVEMSKNQIVYMNDLFSKDN